MNDLFEQLQSDVTAKLNAEEYFSNVPVVTYRRLMTASEDGKSEANREQPWTIKKDGALSGVGVMVRMPSLQVPHPNVSGPQSRLLLIVTVVEQPLVSESSTGLNSAAGAYKSGEKVALKVREALHHFRWDGANILFCEGDSIRPNDQTKFLRAYDVILHGWFHVESPSKVAAVASSLVDGVCTLSCDTSEATIYYTVDGSFPSAQNSAALIYGAPFALTEGTMRAAAYKTGMIGSDVTQETP